MDELTKGQVELFDALTTKEQQIAMGLLNGCTSLEAYRIAFPRKQLSDKSAIKYVDECKKRARFRAFILSIHEGLISDAIISRTEALERLTVIARSSLQDLVRFKKVDVGTEEAPEERIVWELREEVIRDPSLLDGVASLEQGAYGPKIKMYSAPGALQQIANMSGWTAPAKVNHSSPDGSMSPKESAPALDVTKLSSETLHELVEMHYAAAAKS